MDVLNQPLWKLKFKRDNVIQIDLILDEALCLRAGSCIYLVNINTGIEKWKFNLRNIRGEKEILDSSLVIGDNVIFGGTTSGILFAVDAESGKERWHFQYDNYISSSRSPFYVDKFVFYGCGDENIYALDAINGEVVWKFKAKENISSPFVSNGLVFFSDTVYSNLYQLDVKTGKSIKRSKIEGMIENFVVTDQGAYFVTEFNIIYKIDANNRVQKKMEDMDNASLEAVDHGIVLHFGYSIDNITAYDLETSKKRWTFKTDDKICGFVHIDGIMYISTYSEYLYLVDVETGKKKISYKTDGTISPQKVLDRIMYYSRYEDNSVNAVVL